MANKGTRGIFGPLVDKDNYIFNITITNAIGEYIFNKEKIKSFLEFEFENREIDFRSQTDHIYKLLLTFKKINYDDRELFYFSFKNVTDFSRYKTVFEELYDSLTMKTIELDTAISEKDEAYRLLKEKDDELLHQMNFAKDIQQEMFPEHKESFNNYNLMTKYLPANLVSGDIILVWSNDDIHLDTIIADVTGHGVPSAFITMVLKMSIENISKKENDPAKIITMLNEDIYSILSNAAIFVTLLYTRLNTETGEIQSINCGHPAPLIIKKDGRIEQSNANGIMLGVVEKIEFDVIYSKTEDDDTICLITDGITEASNYNGKFFEDIFYKLLSENTHLNSVELADKIINELHNFTEHRSAQDDISLVVIKKNTPVNLQ